MSKPSKILLIVGSLLIFYGLILSSFNIKKVISPLFNGKISNLKEEIKTFNPNETQKIIVKTENEKIKILPTDEELIKITYYTNTRSQYNFSTKDNSLRMENNDKQYFSLFNFDLDFAVKNITIEIPEELILEYDIETKNAKIEIKDLNIDMSKFESNNGSIKLSNIISEYNVNIETDNSNILLEDTKIDKLIARTSNGSIKLSNIKIPNIDIKTSNASINLDNIFTKKILAKTSNGSIKFNKFISENINFITSNGSIKGTLSGNETDYNMSLKTSNASISVDDIKYGSRLDKINGNGHPLNIKTSNGSISLRFN